MTSNLFLRANGGSLSCAVQTSSEINDFCMEPISREDLSVSSNSNLSSPGILSAYRGPEILSRCSVTLTDNRHNLQAL